MHAHKHTYLLTPPLFISRQQVLNLDCDKSGVLFCNLSFVGSWVLAFEKRKKIVTCGSCFPIKLGSVLNHKHRHSDWQMQGACKFNRWLFHNPPPSQIFNWFCWCSKLSLTPVLVQYNIYKNIRSGEAYL